MTERQELNAAIARHFGFTEHESSGWPTQWTYPPNWHLRQGGVPNFDVPDFLSILDAYLELMGKHDGHGPREFFGRFGPPEAA